MRLRSVAGVLVIILGVATMIFANQTTGEGYAPPHKVELAHWLETDVWVNPYLLIAGALIAMGGVLLCVRYRSIRHPAVAVSALPLAASVAILVLWKTGVHVNVTSWVGQ
jgi:hypothetical protein